MTFDKKRRGRTAGIALALSLFSSSIPAARAQEPASPALTFQEALRRALEANPNTARARSDVNVAEAQLRQLRSAILPRVELNGTATRNSDEVTFDASGFEATILPENDWRYDVTLRQPLYAGGRELKAIRQGRLNASGAQQGVRLSEEQVLLGAATFYLAIVQGDELLAVERRNLELAERRRAQAQAFYEAGEVTRVDVLGADADTKAAQRAIASAEQIRETAVSRLRETLALDLAPGGTLQVQDPKLTFPRLPDAETLVREAQANRSEVRQAEIVLEINQLEVAKQRAARLPTVSGELSFFNQASNFPAERYGAFSVNLTVPIWDSGEIASRVRTAEERRRQAEITLEESKRAVREDVLEALLDLQTAERSLALARDQLAAAEAEHQQTFELYRAQEATALDLQSAEGSLVAARRAVVSESLSRDLAELNVWSATGTLKNTILSEEEKP